MVESHRLEQSIYVQVGGRKQVGKTGKEDCNFFSSQLFNCQPDYDEVNAADQVVVVVEFSDKVT